MTDARRLPAPTLRGTLGTAWRRTSARLVPLLAVVSALVLTVVFMVFTGARGSLTRGLTIAGTAYSALVEGALGLALNDTIDAGDLRLAAAYAGAGDGPLPLSGVGRLGRAVENIATYGGVDVVARYGALLRDADLDAATADLLGGQVPNIRQVGAAALLAFATPLAELDEAERPAVRALADGYSDSADAATLVALAPSTAAYDAEQRVALLALVNDLGIVAAARAAEAAATFAAQGLDPAGQAGDDLAAIARIGAQRVLDVAATAQQMQRAAVFDVAGLGAQLRVLGGLEGAGVLADTDVLSALDQLDDVSADTTLVQRPGNRVFVAPGAAGVVAGRNGAPEAAYLDLGGRALLFFPANLEQMIVRSIPFVIAGLAVALGFKAGLFNIGAEGQLYAGALAAVLVGYLPQFAGLPGALHIPLLIGAGLLGGFAWGAIPGALKAFAGAHEVITTIMLNFIAVRLVDWLIKGPMLDPAASTPKTPFIVAGARLPTITVIPVWLWLAAGVLLAGWLLWRRRAALGARPLLLLRPILWGLVVALGGLFLRWTAVNGRLHVGLLVMVGAVLLTDWFLARTTVGFELRTVGQNANAARYAGMRVGGITVLALALSGALAGLAGTVEISGVQYNVQPAFFSGLGFDAIAVALLARNNPRNMIAAGFLWGGLLAGAPLMQTRADISIDLVKIMQALIIMFIAADAIVRQVWRVPEASAEEKAATQFSTGWGG